MMAKKHMTAFFKLLLLVQSIPFVRSNSNITTKEKLAISESTTEVIGLPCTSRTLSDIALGSYNLTIDDDSDPFCPEGYFCDLLTDGTEDSIDDVLGLCKPCGGDADTCLSEALLGNSPLEPESIQFFAEIAAEEECQNQCGEAKNTCSSAEDCTLGLFCNFVDGDEGGYCEQCPYHMFYCEEGKNLTSQGLSACESSCSITCNTQSSLGITNPVTGETSFMEDVRTLNGSPQLIATGPIVDCGLGLEPCEGAEGSICLIERGLIAFVNKTRNCHAGGGIGAVIYNVEASCENIRATLAGREVMIPALSLPHFDGKAVLEKAKAMPPETPMLATVDIGGHGMAPVDCTLGCIEDNECLGTELICDWDNGDFGDCMNEEKKAYCDMTASFIGDIIPCTGEREFCDFSSGGRGICQKCPEVAAACFFSNLVGEGVRECNAVCNDGGAEKIESKPCKFCPQGDFVIGDIGDGFSSTEEQEEAVEPCQFCNTTTASTCSSVDRWDMLYPERTISMFGIDVECWAVAEFYRSVIIEAGTAECESVRSFNYICGCSDSPGYAGANSEAKKNALVWLPRVGAFLSMIGSTMMIIGVCFDEKRKKKVIGNLIITLCAFDIVGSIGYAFTSYATPIEDYIQGANGSDASCKAQGFFIQVGTISLYVNVSIAFYYLLIIQYSWREHRLVKSRVHYLLFVVPIIFGAIFAFAGIPYYDNSILWCNNSRKYWSEIPVALAILIATFIMINLCWFVYKSEMASSRFRRHSAEDRSSLSTAFFKQSLVYLGAFYLTWPPYLALQVMIANGKAFSNYGFILFAGTAVTLQGFWNYVFHVGLNGKSIKQNVKATWTTVRSQAGSVVFKSTNRSKNENSRFSNFDSRTSNFESKTLNEKSEVAKEEPKADASADEN